MRTNPKAVMRRIREKYPYHVVRKIEGQPRPDKDLDQKEYGPFGRVPEVRGESNRWCFETETAREKFQQRYGGHFP